MDDQSEKLAAAWLLLVKRLRENIDRQDNPYKAQNIKLRQGAYGLVEITIGQEKFHINRNGWCA